MPRIRLRPLHLTFIFGTRPETIKLAPLILEAQRNGHRVEVVLTGQHREMARQMLRVFGLKADRDLDVMVPHQTLGGLSARTLQALEDQLDPRVKRDWVVVQGDTSTAFIGGYWAFLRQIPVAHVEAGLRTYDLNAPFPEEGNRQLLSRVATLHFAPTRAAARALRAEGVPSSAVKIVGNTGIDALLSVAKALGDSKNRLTFRRNERLSVDLQKELEGRRVILVTAHRRESFGAEFEGICQGIRNAAICHPEARFVYPVHPNPKVRAPVESILRGVPNVRLIEPLSYVSFVELLQRSDVVLTDSGGVQEEAPSFRKPVLVMRWRTERPEGVKQGFSRLVGTDPKKIESGIARALRYGCEGRGKNPYGDGNASGRILKELALC